MNEPKYKKIEKYLKDLIKDKKLKEGDLLPSENQLCEMFGVTRMTVRAALSNMVAEGYIAKKKGIGSVVIAEKIYDNISRVSGFAKEMAFRGVRVSTIVNKFNVMEADELIASKLNISIRDNVWQIGRTRLANGERVSYMETYMPVKMFSSLNKKHCEESLYQYIEEDTGHKITTSERSVEAIIASKDLKKIFKLDSDAPILHIEQISRLNNNIIFEYSHTYHYNYKLILKAINE